MLARTPEERISTGRISNWEKLKWRMEAPSGTGDLLTYPETMRYRDLGSLLKKSKEF